MSLLQLIRKTSLEEEKEKEEKEDDALPNYKLIEYISEGTYGSVSKYYDDKNKKDVAIKEFTMEIKQNDFHDKTYFRELYYGKLFDHPNIIKINSSFISGEKGYLAMDLATSDLLHFLRGNKISPKIKQSIICAIGKGLQHIHHGGFSHCDIKSQNVLVFRNDEYINFKIADLGFVRPKENIYNPYICQTEVYRAPEQVYYQSEQRDYFKNYSKYYKDQAENNFDIISEYWSFGIVCLDILYNYSILTWDGFSIKNYTDRVLPRSKELYIKNPDKFYYDIIEYMSKDPRRTSYQSIINIFGRLDTEKENQILENVCNFLLQLDRRNRSLTKFLNLYCEKELAPKYNFGRLPENYRYNIDSKKIDVNGIINFLKEFRMPLIHISNLVDIYLQYSSLFLNQRKSLFLLVTAWMLGTIYIVDYGHKYDDIFSMLKNFSGTKYSMQEFFEMIKDIEANKIFYNYESLYFQLDTLNESITGVMEMCFHLDRYLSFGTPGKAALFIKQYPKGPEEPKGVKRKFPKTNKYYDISDPKLREVYEIK